MVFDMGPGTLLAKMDLHHAYTYNLAVHADNYPLLAIGSNPVHRHGFAFRSAISTENIFSLCRWARLDSAQ